MQAEKYAVAIFEDEERKVQELRDHLSKELLIVALTTIEACRSFVKDPKYAESLLAGAILVACIVDGNIAPTTYDKRDGKELLTTMRTNPRFEDVLLISNSGGGKLTGADTHLEKSTSRQEKYLPHLFELIEIWKAQNKAHINLDTLQL